MTTRRAFVLLGSTAWIGAPSLAQGAKRRVAYLGATSLAASRHLISAFIEGMRDLGYVEGRNLELSLSFAEGDAARLESLTRSILSDSPEVLVVSTDTTARRAAALSRTTPIVFVLGFDPVGLGLVESLAIPKRNATGFSILDRELSPKRLALLKEAHPRLSKAGILFRSSDASDDVRNAVEQRLIEDAGNALRVSFVPARVRDASEIPAALSRISQEGANGLLNVSDTLFFLKRRELAEAALASRLPWATSVVEYADAGALLAYGPDYPAIYRRASTLVDRVLKGASPAGMPVEQANVYELVINLETAKALGLQISSQLLLQATRVIG
jgi:putative ABC transport system substrate-binding protein